MEFLTVDAGSDADGISALNLESGDEVVVPLEGYLDLFDACTEWSDGGVSFTTEIESIKWEDLVSTYGVAGVAE